MQDEIDKIRKEAESELEKANLLQKVLDKYPDLKKHTNRWNKVRYSSASVNGDVTDVEIYHNCGCCNDSPLEVSPFLEIEGMRIYGDPASVMVGEKYEWGIGDKPWSEWEEKLDEHGFAEVVKKKVQEHFKDNPPVTVD